MKNNKSITMAKRRIRREVIVSILIIIFFCIWLSPLIVALSGSFRDPASTDSFLHLFSQFTNLSYKAALEKINYARSLKNSIILTVASVLILLVCSSLAGYAIARLRNKLGRFMQIFFLAGMMVSSQMSIVPIFKLMINLNLTGTYLAPICMYVTQALPFSVFVYINFVKSGVPISLEEAARIDGAGVFTTYLKIVLPLTKPVLVTIAITQGVPIWNDFFIGMLFLQKANLKTLPLQMLSFMGNSETSAQWSTMFAACILTALPMLIIYAILQKQFVAGATSGALK